MFHIYVANGVADEGYFPDQKDVHVPHEKKRATKKRGPLAGPNHRSVLFEKTEADLGPQSSIAPPVAFFLGTIPISQFPIS